MANTNILRVRYGAEVILLKALPPDHLGEWRARQRAQQSLRDAIAFVAHAAPTALASPTMALDAAQSLGSQQTAEQMVGQLHIVVRQLADAGCGVAVAQADAQTTVGERILFVRAYGSLAVALAEINTRYGLYLEPESGWSPVLPQRSVAHVEC
ncbi:MAG: hypothetical protein H0X24_14550 [Ktedonobacterales bacterium]|nr:hypothetical protein [Ktedonobacterales bacterium]